MNEIKQIKENILISDLISSYNVDLKPKGRGQFLALCPFHTEKTPSFHVNNQYGNYKCFGCGVSGDIFSFLESYQGVSFNEALVELAEKANVELNSNYSNSEALKYKKAQDIVSAIAEIYRDNYKALHENSLAKQNITQRGLSLDNDVYGYSSENMYDTKEKLEKQGFDIQEVIDLGFLNSKGIDVLNGRLILIYTNRTGKVVGFSGRNLKDDNFPKYINSADSIIFNKSNILFHEFEARKSSYDNSSIYLAEGQFDVLSLANNGYMNSVCSSGTAVTEQHINKLINMSNNGKINFVFDSDKAGKKAIRHIFEKYPNVHEYGYVIVLPENLDPCDYFLQSNTKELPESHSLVDWVYRDIKNKYDNLADPMQSSAFLRELNNDFFKYLKSYSFRDSYITQTSFYTNIPIDKIRLSVENKDKHKPTIKEEVEEISVSNETLKKFLDALSFWFYNKDIIGEININNYPKKFNNLVEELNNKRNAELFVPEIFNDKNKQLVEYFTKQDSIDTSILTDNEVVSHYNYLVNRAKVKIKEEQKNIIKNKTINLINSGKLSNEQIDIVLKELNSKIEKISNL